MRDHSPSPSVMPSSRRSADRQVLNRSRIVKFGRGSFVGPAPQPRPDRDHAGPSSSRGPSPGHRIFAPAASACAGAGPTSRSVPHRPSGPRSMAGWSLVSARCAKRGTPIVGGRAHPQTGPPGRPGASGGCLPISSKARALRDQRHYGTSCRHAAICASHDQSFEAFSGASWPASQPAFVNVGTKR